MMEMKWKRPAVQPKILLLFCLVQLVACLLGYIFRVDQRVVLAAFVVLALSRNILFSRENVPALARSRCFMAALLGVTAVSWGIFVYEMTRISPDRRESFFWAVFGLLLWNSTLLDIRTKK